MLPDTHCRLSQMTCLHGSLNVDEVVSDGKDMNKTGVGGVKEIKAEMRGVWIHVGLINQGAFPGTFSISFLFPQPVHNQKVINPMWVIPSF